MEKVKEVEMNVHNNSALFLYSGGTLCVPLISFLNKHLYLKIL
jgi:hypothetical protein